MKKIKRKGLDSRRRWRVNRKYKDRLFRFIFQDKKDLLDLYNAVNQTDYQNPEELLITTLEDAVFLGMKNDLSFIIGASLNLYEHQSTQNANMPLRGLFYFSNLYQEYIEQGGYNLYGSRRIELPQPNYLVFYNGDRDAPDHEERFLSEAFLSCGKESRPCLECRVQILNINKGHNRELMGRCQKLWEYAEFIDCVKRSLRGSRSPEVAIRQAVDECIEQGILTDVLNRCKTEVIRMLLTEYDEKKTLDYIRREEREIGEEIGKEIGEARVNKLNRLLLEQGLFEDMARAASDQEYQRELFRRYHI